MFYGWTNLGERLREDDGHVLLDEIARREGVAVDVTAGEALVSVRDAMLYIQAMVATKRDTYAMSKKGKCSLSLMTWAICFHWS